MADPEAIRAFEHAGWERAANTYEAAFATATRQFIPGLLATASVSAGQSVLDVACGPGFVGAAAADRGAAVRGLDFSQSMLAVARRLHPEIAFDEGDAEVLPYPDGAFDAVISNFGLHHVPRPVQALRQAHRILRSGGSMAFTVWAAPAENIAWRLVFDAIRRLDDMAASQAPAPGWFRDGVGLCGCAGTGRVHGDWDQRAERRLASSGWQRAVTVAVCGHGPNGGLDRGAGA